jgi:hypothetical protein
VNPCYSFNKYHYPNSGMDQCATASGGPCADTALWFWLIAGIVGIALISAGGSK